MTSEHQARQAATTSPEAEPTKRPAAIRCCVGGILMGLANLVPGVSGGTMILIMGLYDEFISAVADVTRFRLTRRNVLVLGLIGGAAAITVVVLAKVFAQLVLLHPLVMYALFIGMTLGGVPLLWKMMKPIKPASVVTLILGLAVMIAIAMSEGNTQEMSKEEKAQIREKVKQGEFELEPAYGLDVVAGVLGMSAMVLPGISGAYMLLLLDRYDQILAAISMTKSYALSMGKEGSPEGLFLLVPVSIGAILSLVVVTNLIKWLLRHHEKPTVGFLLGIVLGSAFSIWGRTEAETVGDHAIAVGVLLLGLVGTIGLTRLGDSGEGRGPKKPVKAASGG